MRVQGKSLYMKADLSRRLRSVALTKQAICLALLLAVLQVAGCAPAPTEAELDSRADSMDTQIQCAESATAWPPFATDDQRVCTGAWVYAPYAGSCYAAGVDGPNCGWSEPNCPTLYNACSNPQFGVATYTSKTVENTTVKTVCAKQRVCCEPGEYCKPPCHFETVCEPATVCVRPQDEIINAEVAAYLPMYEQQIRANVVMGTCSVTFNWLPKTYISKEDPLCGVRRAPPCGPKECRHASHGLDPDPGACGLTPAYAFTASALSVAQLKTALGPRFGDSRYVAPTCLTCNDKPMDTAGQVQAKFDCLLNSLSLGDATHQPDIIAQMKLLYEFRGDLLSGVTPSGVNRKDYVRSLYVTLPGQRPNCGSWLDPLQTATTTPAEGQQQMCDRLAQPHVPPAVAEDSAQACIDAVAAAKSFPLAPTRQSYLDRWARVTIAELGRAVTSIPSTVTTPDARIALLRARLRLLQKFYEAAGAGVYAGSDAIAAFWRDVTAVASFVVKGADQRGESALRAAAKAGTMTTSTFERYVGDQFQSDQEVLAAAFPLPAEGLAPTTGAPLLYVMASALTGLSARAEGVDRFHDLGCRFQSCVGVRTELSELHGVLGALANKADLDAEVKASSHLAPEWKAVFQRIVTGHQTVLQEAVKVATGRAAYDPALVLERPKTALDGRWRRPDGFAIDFWLLGDALNGQGDVPTISHSFSGTFNRASQKADVSVKRVNQLNGCTTMMNSTLEVLSETSIRITVSSTDGKCDVPTWYSESFEYSRVTDDPGSLPVGAFSPIIIANGLLAKRYATTGRFGTEPNDHLNVGLLPDRLDRMMSDLSGHKASLDSAVSVYRSNVQTLGSTLLAELENEQLATGVRAHADRIIEEIEQQGEDLAGLRLNAAIDERRFADTAVDFGKVMDALSSQSNYLVQSNPPVNLSITGAKALFTGTQTTVADIAVAGSKLSVGEKGTIEVTVKDYWAPVCAIRQATEVMGVAFSAGTNYTTGPEGFVVTVDGAKLTSRAHETYSGYDSHSSRVGRETTCKGLRGQLGLGLGFIGYEAYAYGEECDVYDRGSTRSDGTRLSTQTTTQQRESAAFALGLRLPTTPFPQFPAGSLLIVSTLPGNATAAGIIDAKVVQRQTVLLAEAASDVYLVVNDRADCADLDTNYALSVQLVQRQPVGQWAHAFYGAIESARAQLRQDATARLSQGRLLPHDVELLQGSATLQLETSCREAGCDVAQLPKEMTGFFANLVSAELARAERQLEINAIERRREVSMIELKGVLASLATAQRKGGLLRELTKLRLRNIDEASIRLSAEELIRVVDGQLYPYIHIKYTTTDVSPLNQLLTLPVATPIDQLAEKANLAVDTLKNNLSFVVTGTPEPRKPTPVAVAFPRPGSTTYKKFWREADAARSRLVWQQIRGNQTISIPIHIEDLYPGVSGMAGLTCSERVPVIHSMGLYVAVPSGYEAMTSPLNTSDVFTQVFVAPGMTWPGNDGPERYTFADPTWLVPKVSVLYGKLETATDYFRTLPTGDPVFARRAAAGISPISTFDFPPLSAWVFDPATGSTIDPHTGAEVALHDAEAVVVLFTLDTKDGPELGWIDSCVR